MYKTVNQILRSRINWKKAVYTVRQSSELWYLSIGAWMNISHWNLIKNKNKGKIKKCPAIDWNLPLMQTELLHFQSEKKGVCSRHIHVCSCVYIRTPQPEVFTKYSSCWEWVHQLISLRTPAAIRNAFAIQSNVFIPTVANSETQRQFQLTALSEQHPKSSQRCADNAHPGTSVLWIGRDVS